MTASPENESADPVGLARSHIAAFAASLGAIDGNDAALLEQLGARIQTIDGLSRRVPGERAALMRLCFDACAGELDQSPLMAHMRHKPLGYAGDYQLIDWIYTNTSTSTGRGRFWDQFFLNQPAAASVRKRKRFFIDTVSALAAAAQSGFVVLDVASGSCRDVKEALDAIPRLPPRTRFHCIDTDRRANAYAGELLQGRARADIAISWQEVDAFAFHPEGRYDLVWSAGLFDYLNDRMTVLLLKKLWQWTAPQGMLAVGNFHPSNPSRLYMEWCGDWILEHRTADDMLTLCERAGLPLEAAKIKQEPSGVCIFCLVSKGA
jgi:hypothetical protein